MIKELADYEHESDKVLATEESLSRTLTFSPSAPGSQVSTQHTNPGYAKTLILRLPAQLSQEDQEKGFKAGAVAGMAMFFHNYSTWRSKPGIHLEDLFVRPQYRRRGYGKILIQALAMEVLRIDGGRLEWSCLKRNEPSLNFYKSLGAERMDDWVQLRVDGEALEKLARCQQ